MLAGAVAWLIGNARWLAGAAIYRVVFWWMAFVVLTIAGERLELNRLLRPRAVVRWVFVAVAAMLLTGAAVAGSRPVIGVRVVGAGLVALTGWLAVNDIARRTVRQPGVTRFIALCLLSGYGWLAVAGVLAVSTAASEPGANYDAVLHAVFLGFVVAMIFGHAPIVFPAILGRPLPYRRAFYAHLALLHLSVAIRLAGDLVESFGRARAWGGALSAAALAVFVINTVSSLATAAVPARR